MVVVDLGILKVMVVVWRKRKKMVVLLELVGMERELGRWEAAGVEKRKKERK